MGFLKGSVSFTRYRVKGELPGDYREVYPESILRNAFRELDETSPDERSAGWVSIYDFMDNRFAGQDFFLDHYIVLSLRIDTRKVPAQALRNSCRKAEAEAKAAQNKQFLSKAHKKEIQERVRLQLLKRVIPTSATCDMIWNLEEGSVWFASVSDKVRAEFTTLFRETFGLSLWALFPYTLAQKHLDTNRFREVDLLGPCDFV